MADAASSEHWGIRQIGGNRSVETLQFLLQKSDQTRFVAVTQLEDSQAIRAVAVHPGSGDTYAIGTNSKALYICNFPDISNLRYLTFAVCTESYSW